MKNQQQAAKYMKAIRNEAKKTYAQRYWLFLGGSPGQPECGKLSYMAAQAVRNTLQAIANAA